MGQNIAIAFFEKFIGNIDNAEPIPVTGWRMVEILWPLNDIFRPYLERIRSIKYDTKFETDADRAVERFAENPVSETWDDLSPASGGCCWSGICS